jgi:hypothetical protein
MIRIGGRDFPIKSVHNCRTCQSPHRMFIENELLSGRSYMGIARQVADLPTGHLPPPGNQSITKHVKEGHLPQPIQTRRRIVDKRAEKLGAAVAGEDDLSDYITLLDMTINRGGERLLAGEIDPGMGDLLNAIGLKQRIEATSTEGYDTEAYQQSMFIYFEEAQNVMSHEQWTRFAKGLASNPLLKALMAKQREHEIVSGEVEETVATPDE